MAIELSEDIVSNIFLKLPAVKSILRCRSVCKAWRRLLCDPDFVRMHFNQHHRFQEKLLVKTFADDLYSLDYYDETQGKAVPRDFPLNATSYFLGSCNGLLWIGADIGVNYVRWDMVLWNPSTGDYKILPNPCPSVRTRYNEGNQFQGLGCCDNEYKMVRVIRNGKYLQVDVYTLKSNLWKRIIEDVYDDGQIFYCPRFPGTAVTGFICWLVVYRFNNGDVKRRLWGFDLKNEKLTDLPLPSEISCTMDDAYLTVIEGCLGFSCVRDGARGTGDITVWKMRELDDKKKEWIKTITLASQRGLRNLLPCYNRPLVWLDNGKILFYKNEEKEATTTFALYDPKTDILESYPIDWWHQLMDWVTYSESLVSPNA